MIWSTGGSPSLVAENLQLKRRVAELEKKASSPISADPKSGEVHIDHFSIGPLNIEKLDVHSQALASAANDVEGSLTNLKSGHLFPCDLKQLSQKPVIVRALKAQIPVPFVNSILEQVAGAELKKSGLSDLRLSQAEPGQLTVNGTSHKGLPLPFEVTGHLSATDDGKLKFHVRRSKLGIIPLPNALVSLAGKLAGDQLAKAGVAADGQEFTIDPAQYKPKNVLFQLDKLNVVDGAILVEGGAPVVSRPSPIPKIRRKR